MSMHNTFALEAHAQQVMRERLHQAAQAALAAQLPHNKAAFPRLDLAARLQLASGLRALAVRLDPCGEPALVALSSR